MDSFAWPDHIRFDDTESDINEARRIWLILRAMQPGGGAISDFLEFMQAYAGELESQRAAKSDVPKFRILRHPLEDCG